MHETRWSISTLIVLVIAVLPSTTAAQTWQTLIDDEFIGPNGTNLSAHAPETNVPAGMWSLGGSPALILQGQAVRPSGSGPFHAFATIDARVSDGDIGLYWYAVPQGDNSQLAGGLIFRYVDPNNFMLVHYWQQRVWLWKMVAGSFVHIAYADVAPPQGAWHWMAVRAIGSSLAVNWDGVDVIVVNESTYQTATRHGVWFRTVADPYSYVGTFRVRSQQQMLPPPVTSVTASPNPVSMPIASTQVITATGYAANGGVVQSASFAWATSNANVAWIQTTTQNTATIVARGVGEASITATEAGGVSRTIPVAVTNTTPQQKQVLINDEFIAPEGSGLTSHLPETNLSGGSWLLGGSPGIVVHNQAVHPTGTGPLESYATIDSLASDADVGVYWYPNPTGDPSTLAGGIIFRYVNPDSYLLVHYWQEKIWLWKRTPSGFVHIAEAAVPPPYNAWHWVEIRGVGTQISVYWDGVGKIGVNDSTNVLATRHGIWFRSVYDYGSVIGTFTVKGTLPEPITSVTVTPTSLSLPVDGAKSVTAAAYSASGTYQPTNFAWSSSNTSTASIGATTFNTAKIIGESVGAATITATAPNGVSTNFEVTVIEKCLGLCVFDSFTGSGSLETHSPDTNVMDTPWVVTGGPTIGVHVDRIRPTANGFTLSLATIDGGNSNGTVRAEWIPPAPGVAPSPNFGLLARYVADDEYFVATYENGRVNLDRRYPGGITRIGSAAVDGNLSANHTMQVRLDGPGIQVWWDGVQRIQAIDSTNQNATRHGVYWNVEKDPSSSIDNFMFIGGEKSVATTIKVSSSTINAVAQGYPLFVSAEAFTELNAWIPWTSFTWHSSNPAIAFVEQLDHRFARVVGLASGTTTITATSAEGLTATFVVLVTIPESDTTVRVYDQFVGAMHTNLPQHVPDRYITGAAWSTAVPDAIRINDVNSLYSVPRTGYEVSTIESGTANGTVSANWRPLNANIHSNGGIVFRYVDDTSYWHAVVMEHVLYLRKGSAADPTTVASVGIGNPTGGVHQIAALLDGPRIQIWFNGAQQIEVIDSMNVSASRHGVIFYSAYDTASNIDDFSVNTEFITPVRPPQPLLPCFNGFWPPNGQHWPPSGGSNTVTLSAPFECAWQAEATVPWIHLTTVAGVGDAYLEYSVEPNTGGQRSGTIVVNGSQYSVTQGAGDNTGLPPGAPSPTSCLPGLMMEAVALTQIRVHIQTEVNCEWSASTVTPDVQLTASSGIGSAQFDVLWSQPTTGPVFLQVSGFLVGVIGRSESEAQGLVGVTTARSGACLETDAFPCDSVMTIAAPSGDAQPVESGLSGLWLESDPEPPVSSGGSAAYWEAFELYPYESCSNATVKGNVGEINVAMSSPNSLVWNARMYNPFFNFGPWSAVEFKGFHAFNTKTTWYAPHGSQQVNTGNPALLQSGDIYRLSIVHIYFVIVVNPFSPIKVVAIPLKAMGDISCIVP